jgi:HSP20 family protein
LIKIKAGNSAKAHRLHRSAHRNQEDRTMAEADTKTPATPEAKTSVPTTTQDVWQPFQSLRREIDRLFEDVDLGFHRPQRRVPADADPVWRRDFGFVTMPAVDVAEKDDAFEITAELPGLAEKDVNVSHANGTLTIKGEKKAETEEKKKDYYLSERRYGAFQRSFSIPEGVDADEIDARFKDGVLTVRLPKTAEAKQPAKKIAVKAG